MRNTQQKMPNKFLTKLHKGSSTEDIERALFERFSKGPRDNKKISGEIEEFVKTLPDKDIMIEVHS
ncbi:MAG: hypothetical protein WED05_00550 [Candidatus Atabeyarchaeum deiterrae]